MIDRKLFHIVWIGVVTILLIAGVAIGLRSGNVTVYDREYVWSADPGTGEGEPVRLVRGRKVQGIQRDMNKLILAFNKTFIEAEAVNLRDSESRLELPKLLIQGLDHTTVRVLVENSWYLTQRMGSSGAQDFLATATYTMTECPVITAVDFVFAEGDHAAPGIYTRMSFTGYRTVYVRK
jgi:hypothetical protein